MIKGSLKAVSGAVMLLAAGCGIATNSDKFDWKATESAPKNFPIKIIDGTFIYHGRSDGTGLYVPSGGLLDKGWGEMISSHIVGPDLKPLPDRDRKSTRLHSSHAPTRRASDLGIATNSDKYDWKATESAPKNFPIKIIDGTFIYHGRSDGTGLYVPSGGLLDKGWGEMISSHIVGPDLKPLPDRLKITFFSYLEDQFYEGVFDLPYETILSLFKEQSTNGGPEYHRIMVGVAPGGYVAVWLKGHIKTTEVFFGRAEPVEGELKAFGRVIPNRSEYVLSEVEDNVDPSVLRRIREEGIPFDRWANFRQRYHWKPVFMYGNEPASGVQIKYFNGEGERLFPPLESELVTQTRAIPMFMQFSEE